MRKTLGLNKKKFGGYPFHFGYVSGRKPPKKLDKRRIEYLYKFAMENDGQKNERVDQYV